MTLTRPQATALHTLYKRRNARIPLRKVTGDALVARGLANDKGDGRYTLSLAGRRAYEA